MPVAADPTIENVVLLACGSYNPVTNMHLRMFEVARDALRKSGRFRVLGGIISPVADAFGKEGAGPLPGGYRRRADRDGALLHCRWQRRRGVHLVAKTRQTIEIHRRCQRHGGDSADRQTAPLAARLMLLCGADLLASFARPGLWRTEDMVTIARDYGMVVLARSGFNPQKFIYECDAINPFESVRYLLPDSVIDYVYRHRAVRCRADCCMDSRLSHLMTGPRGCCLEFSSCSSSSAPQAAAARPTHDRLGDARPPASEGVPRLRRPFNTARLLVVAAVDDQTRRRADCLPQQQQHGDSRHDRHRQQRSQQDASSVAAIASVVLRLSGIGATSESKS
uniref:CTP_transf_like domain-containing protein n=1 Tax=Macrostomum lignano TaxID=282301 RepID=A0A1I8F4R3_9PLAT